MKRVHITERIRSGLTLKLRIALAAVWIVPLVILLATFRWNLPCVGLRLLCKSTWVLFAGAMLSWFPISLGKYSDKMFRELFFLLGGILVVSSFLLPFGLGHWGYYGSYYGFRLNPSWRYGENLMLSFLLHYFPVACIVELVREPSTGSLSVDSSWQMDDGQPKAGSGMWGGHSWLDGVWKGGQISDDFYGKHGEFDRNDESRRVSEDMQQFRSANPDADLSDHYYWDDVRDADTDGYLEDD